MFSVPLIANRHASSTLFVVLQGTLQYVPFNSSHTVSRLYSRTLLKDTCGLCLGFQTTPRIVPEHGHRNQTSVTNQHAIYSF